MLSVSHVLPPILGYFTVALLAVIPNTHVFRLALWPAVALSAWRAGASLDMSVTDPDQRYNSTLFVVSIVPYHSTLMGAQNGYLVHYDLYRHAYLGVDDTERTACAVLASRKGISIGHPGCRRPRPDVAWPRLGMVTWSEDPT